MHNESWSFDVSKKKRKNKAIAQTSGSKYFKIFFLIIGKELPGLQDNSDPEIYSYKRQPKKRQSKKKGKNNR